MNRVRRAETGDIPAILELLVQVDMVHHNGRPDLFKGPAVKYNAAELEQILADEGTPVFVCVNEEGRVLGHGLCILQHSGGELMVEHTTLYIDDICVDAAARGQGVGRMLFERIREYARELGAYNVTLNVWSCNPGARAFYEKLGLVPYKTGMEMILDAEQKE